jgi:hypothetical protein
MYIYTISFLEVVFILFELIFLGLEDFLMEWSFEDAFMSMEKIEVGFLVLYLLNLVIVFCTLINISLGGRKIVVAAMFLILSFSIVIHVSSIAIYYDNEPNPDSDFLKTKRGIMRVTRVILIMKAISDFQDNIEI